MQDVSTIKKVIRTIKHKMSKNQAATTKFVMPKVVSVGAITHKQDLDKLKAAGVCDNLAKPFTKQDFITMCHKIEYDLVES